MKHESNLFGLDAKIAKENRMDLNKDQALNLVNAFKNVRKKEGESDLGHIRSTVSHNVSEEHRQGMLDQLKSYTHYHAHDLCHRIHTFWGRWPDGHPIKFKQKLPEDHHARLVRLGLTSEPVPEKVTETDVEDNVVSSLANEQEERIVLGKGETIALLQQNTGKSKVECQQMLEEVTYVFTQILSSHYDLSVWRFGKFSLRDKPERDVNAFGKMYHVEPTKAVSFKAFQTLKDIINKGDN